MKIFSHFILFTILTISLHAQSTLISGKIIIDDSDEKINLANFVVKNITTNAQIKTNENGLFSIKVNTNDDLLFNFHGFDKRILKISDTMIKKGFIEVHLNIEVIELTEANIKPLKKYWKDNISREETQSEIINKSLGINEEFKKDVVKAFFAAEYLRGLGVPVRYENVIALIDNFSDKEVQTYKRFLKKKNVDKYDLIIEIKDFCTEFYFINDLKIPKGNILDFINYCFNKYNFSTLIKDNNYDKIIIILEEQAPIYLKLIDTIPRSV